MTICIHELTTATCADCRPGTVKQRASDVIFIFDARFPGTCADCSEHIEPGQEIGYVRDQVCCLSCCDAAGDIRRMP